MASVVSQAVGMAAVDAPARRRVAATVAGLGVGLLDGGADALALALPDVLGERRLADLARGQAHRLVEQRRIGQRAQGEAGAVGAGAGVETGAEVGPGFAQRVLVQRGVGCRCARHALARPCRRSALARPACAGRVAPAAGVEVDLHVDDRQRVALDQVDLARRSRSVQCWIGSAAWALAPRTAPSAGQHGAQRELS